MSSKRVVNFLILLILLFFGSYCSSEVKDRNIPGHPPEELKPDDPKEPKRSDMDEDKLKNEYEEKMKENLLLKQQIEDKLKYIKILFVTGIIMFLIIIFILVRICIRKKKEKIIQIESKSSELKSPKKSVNNSNNRILRSNYNLLNSNSDLSISNTISISSSNSNQNYSNYNNSHLNEDKRQNLNSVKIEGFSEEKINDGNKTLTNNPDIFISSKTDKMLYQPYSKEEIYNNEKK